MASLDQPSPIVVLPGSDVNNATLGPGPAIVMGWVGSSNGRGTIDIIWGSFLTIFLCTWTAICLNIPHPKDTKVQILLRKTKWMFWGIVCPEIVLSVAIGQYASARRSVDRFRNLGCQQWTLRHAFFADMGGILLEPKESTPFLVNSRQLAYLVQQGYTQCPSISADEIWDKSKADTMARVLTLAQAGWLAIQLCGRAIQRLPTTTLELSAAAIVFCTLGTFICWLQKPSDVQRGVSITLEFSTKQILLEAGDNAKEPYVHTPLDFVAKQYFTCSYDVMKIFNLRCDSRERPLRQFANDRFPDISTVEKFALFCMTLAYAAFHVIGWNFWFPTRIEQTLWRASSLVVTVTTFFFWVFETIAARQRFGRWDKYFIALNLKKTSVPEYPARNLSKEERADDFEDQQKKAKPVPSWEVALLLPVVVAYVTVRAYMIVEVLVSLRRLPLGAYKTVQISQILPHW